MPLGRISELPTDVLSSVLSLLTTKEAARTSILSCKWRHLWKKSVTAFHRLNIDVLLKKDIDTLLDNVGIKANNILCNHFGDCLAGKFRDYSEKPSWFPGTERYIFVGYVHQILHLDHISLKDSFRLRLYLEEDFSHDIDQCINMAVTQLRDWAHHIHKWIDTARDKRGHNPDFGLSHLVIQKEIYYDGNLYYHFPCLCSINEARSSAKCFCVRHFSTRSLVFNGYSSLIDLRLKLVSIDGDSIVSLLSNCCNLEKLFLFKCKGLVNLDISGPLLKLKQLTIRSCSGLKKIEISAKSLTRFKYCGEWVKLFLVNVPQLSNIIFRTDLSDSNSTLIYARENLSTDAPRLETLMLSVAPTQEKWISRQLPFFANLKTLILLVASCGETLWGFIPLLQASPYLRRLELHLSLVIGQESEDSGFIENPIDFSHLHLEDTILSGFSGHHPHHVEFAKYLLNSATNLQKLTIFWTELCYENGTDAFSSRSKEEFKKLVARASRGWGQLGNAVRPGVEVLFG